MLVVCVWCSASNSPRALRKAASVSSDGLPVFSSRGLSFIFTTGALLDVVGVVAALQVASFFDPDGQDSWKPEVSMRRALRPMRRCHLRVHAAATPSVWAVML